MATYSVLVLGNGGREHELTRQLSLSSNIQTIYAAPGNAGIAQLDKTTNIDLQPTDSNAVAAFVQQSAISFVVIGPEAPLMAGVSDALRARGIAVFGHSKQATQLEASKAFAASFMQRHAIPQPAQWTVHNLPEALAVIAGKPARNYVLKADGLAGGKGVVLPESDQEAQTTLTAMFSGQSFEGAGRETVVIQERLHGPEVSAFVASDGTNLVLLPFAQDHKRLKDHDKGPNTGGMGAYAPVPESIADPAIAQKIRAIAEQSIQGMREDGIPYQGVLYIGLMLAEERGGDPVVIEYNARFGDPETEILLPVLQTAGFDVANMLQRVAQGDISQLATPSTQGQAALTVCLAASGYPESPRKGDIIHGLDTPYPDVIVHHAGTQETDGTIRTNGGRVLYITGIGKTIDQAAARAYAAIGPEGIHFDGMQYRTDIGHQARS
jgi:phosphoribosylamine--glycine ligase